MATQTHSPIFLIVEDDRDTASLIGDALIEHFGPDCARFAENIGDALRQPLHEVDLVLCDYHLPDGTGLEALEQLLQRRPSLPVVLVTGLNEIQTALDAMRRGAYDYVLKTSEFLSIVPLMVEKNLSRWRMKQENLRLQEELEESLARLRDSHDQLTAMVAKLEEMALTDPLTALSNRRHLGEALPRMFAEAMRYGSDLTCTMIDLDGFKRLNDTLGHQHGDDLLRLAGRVIRANCREADLAARFGGDEFVILMPQTGRDMAIHLAQRVMSEYRLAVSTYPPEAQTGMSVGISCVNACRPTNGEDLLRLADRMLYAAKAAGKARIASSDSDVNGPIVACSTVIESA